jgi:hypothetical protein
LRTSTGCATNGDCGQVAVSWLDMTMSRGTPTLPGRSSGHGQPIRASVITASLPFADDIPSMSCATG